jgi:DNA polymerase-3 subunit epsilon
MKTLFLDTETTGLNAKYEELVELSLIDDKGNVLINTLLKPTKKTEWKQAQAIHGISPEMVKDAPTFADIAEQFFTLVNQPNQELVIYNKSFDLPFLEIVLPKRYSQIEKLNVPYSKSKTSFLNKIEIPTHCCMLEFASFYGQWDDYRQSYKWQTLLFASDVVGYEFEGKAHRSLSDTKACHAVWQFLEENGHIFKHKQTLF